MVRTGLPGSSPSLVLVCRLVSRLFFGLFSLLVFIHDILPLQCNYLPLPPPSPHIKICTYRHPSLFTPSPPIYKTAISSNINVYIPFRRA